jgi:CBS-domain-containing membrane protein
MTMNACVADVMTRYAVAVRRGASFKDMAARLSRFRVSAFPVVDDDGKVIGVVSETDMLTRQAVALAREALADGHAGGELRESDGLTAGDLMSQPAVTITPDEPVEHAARLMYNCRVRRLPVVDAGGRLIGIISRADVLAAFDRTDEEIREDIGQVISREFRQDTHQFIVTVRSGIVTLQGAAETARLGRDIVRKIRHVQGVVAVRDRLSYPPD